MVACIVSGPAAVFRWCLFDCLFYFMLLNWSIEWVIVVYIRRLYGVGGNIVADVSGETVEIRENLYNVFWFVAELSSVLP